MGWQRIAASKSCRCNHEGRSNSAQNPKHFDTEVSRKEWISQTSGRSEHKQSTKNERHSNSNRRGVAPLKIQLIEAVGHTQMLQIPNKNCSTSFVIEYILIYFQPNCK
jgi:hypothetical protein